MRDSAPHRLTERRQAILRQTSAALRGRVVTLWRVARDLAVAEVASRPNPPLDAIELDVAAVLRTWVGAVGDKSLWVVCRFDPSRLHVARVRSDVPAPPPAGIERRSPERLILELAGLSLGALERVRQAQGLTATSRARLLADLAVIEDAIEGALDAA